MERLRQAGLRALILVVVPLLLLSVGFAAGVAADRSFLLPETAVQAASDTPSFNVFWQAWDLVEKHYVDRSALDATKMTYGAVEGMLLSLGDTGHTRFLTPEDLKFEREALSGSLEGIGAEIEVRDGLPVVVAPIPDSPAQRAGVRSGDVIMRVDGKDVSNLSVEEVVRVVRGTPGTQVTLSLIHRGDTQITDITITRAKINVPSVTWSMLPGTKVAHVLVSRFAERASDETVAALKAAQEQGATAIILDLRNDPGGIRDEAIAVASQFLKDGNVLIQEDAEGKRTEFKVKPGGVALDTPMVVLINEGSASSAEIVAGALQDHRRAVLIGKTTFGTGTVLSSFQLSDGSAVLLGTEQWLTPSGRQIWHQGIEPDIEVTLPPDAVPLTPSQEAGLTAEQLQSSQDAQLLRALKELSPSSHERRARPPLVKRL